MTRLLLLSFLALTLAACQTPDTAPAEPTAAPVATVSAPTADRAADRATIEAMTADYSAAVQAGDADAVGALYADDAVIHPPGEPSARGRQALDAYFARVHAEPRDHTYATENVVVSEAGDLAYEVGTWAGGKYLSVYRRTPDGWRIAADAWSDDAPPTDTN